MNTSKPLFCGIAGHIIRLDRVEYIETENSTDPSSFYVFFIEREAPMEFVFKDSKECRENLSYLSGLIKDVMSQ